MRPAETADAAIYPLGECGMVVRFGVDRHSAPAFREDAYIQARAMADWLERNPFPGLGDIVPAYVSVAVHYNPWSMLKSGRWGKSASFDAAGIVRSILQEGLRRLDPSALQAGRLVEIPVCYGGEHGPDLTVVASRAGLTETEAAALHASGEYRVAMLGFAPGFPYMTGLPDKLAAPRRAEPRAIVPAGSVGIAGVQTGIYPSASPGGWQLIGRTPWVLFDPQREPPCLLAPGDRVRFVPVRPEEVAR